MNELTACFHLHRSWRSIATRWILVVAVLFSPLAWSADTDNDGIPDDVEVSEGRNPNVKDNDVFTASRLFAMQQYRDFLNREGDVAGIAGWSGLVTAGTYSRPQVIDAFLSSNEFAGLVAPVVRLYFATFLRVPDYAGLTFNAGLVRGGTITVTQLADFFTASPEFMATYGALDNTQFVTLLYNNVLGRAPDTAGLDGWVALLQGGYTRGQVLLGFSDSPEYQATSANEVFVTMMYAGMLRRTPEPGGFNGWLGFLDALTYTREQVINGFFLSTEYHDRFLPALPPPCIPAPDVPDGAFADENCDGIDGDASLSFFVSPAGLDSNAGTRAAPFQTIQAAIAAATASGVKKNVLVAAGNYVGPFALASGVGIFGGYDSAWVRGPIGPSRTVILSASQKDVFTNEWITVKASGLAQPATLADVRIVGPNVSGGGGEAGKSSVAVFANVASLTLTRVEVQAGTGAAGANGANGTSASQTPALSGSPGGSGDEFDTFCNNSSKGAGGSPGINGSNPSRNGGAGGSGGTMDTDCNPFSLGLDARSGTNGSDAAAPSTTFGRGGAGGSGGFTCGPTGAGTPGLASHGNGGGAGSGGSLFANLYWRGSGGSAGGLGLDGKGGGGGGGSGGCDEGMDAYGAGGGGGGAGGARAPGVSTGGGGGGGSFGVLAVSATVTITNSTIAGAFAGAGGIGGQGGAGQPGGAGGPGGSHPGTATPGNGGAGASGGHGGGGGGGAGGISYAIYSFMSLITQSGNMLVIGTGGQGGNGGGAGGSGGNAGSRGLNGIQRTIGTCAVAVDC